MIAESTENIKSTWPEPGIYSDLPGDIYYTTPAVSQSSLKLLLKSPLHYRYAMDNPQEPTEAMRFGTALHTAVLEPNKFKGQYIVAERCHASTKDGKCCINAGKIFDGQKWACGIHGKGMQHQNNLQIISIEQSDQIEGIKQSLMGLPEVRDILNSDCQRELSLAWTRSGIQCKGRIDLYDTAGEAPVILDIKTCEDASEDGFSSAIAKHGYDIQAAFYCDTMTMLTGELHEQFKFIAVEKEPPFACAIYQPHSDVLHLGRHRYEELLEVLQFCQEKNVWPGYPGGIVNIPKWFFERESKR